MRLKILRIKVTPKQIFLSLEKWALMDHRSHILFKLRSDQNSDSRVRHFLEISSSHNSIKTND